MGSSWKQVWDARRLDRDHSSVLEQLMAADGLDSGFGTVTESGWCEFVARTSGKLGIRRGDSVFEVGCGAGAYLYELRRLGCRLGGLDGSAALISYARSCMPDGDWTVGDALDLDISPAFDFVTSCGVFLYFPSLDYARHVLARMVRKARYGVMILDVPDLAAREETLAMRRAILGPEEYERRYSDLDHLYYDKPWFSAELHSLGIRSVEIDQPGIPGHVNAAFRYNVFAQLDTPGRRS